MSQPGRRTYSNVRTINIMNIPNDAILENDQKNFLINYISLGEAARNEFYESRLKEKTCSCWKPFLKLRNAPRKRVRKKNMIWVKKQSDFYIILTMFACKILISKFSWAVKLHLHAFILQKKGLIQKPNKSELTTELKSVITKIFQHICHQQIIIKMWLSISWHMLEKYQ